MLSEGMSSLDLDTLVSAEAGVYTCSVQVTSPYLDIDPYLSANSTVTVLVKITTPSIPTITSNPDVSMYFSGVAIVFTCQFTTDSAVSDDTNAVVSAEWRRGGNVLTGDPRLTVTTPTLSIGVTYSGFLMFSYLTQLDSDNYSCVVLVTSNVNSEFITNSSVSSSIMINVEGPTPDIILTSSTLRLPTHPDYNQATLICTATLPGANQLLSLIHISEPTRPY